MTITRSITIDTPSLPAGYRQAVQRLGKFYSENDCDIIGLPHLPDSLRSDADLVEAADRRTRCEIRTYRFFGDLIRSPEEGNCWYITGYGYLVEGEQGTDPEESGSAPVDMEIMTSLYTTADEARAELDRSLTRAVAAIRLDGQHRDIEIANARVHVHFARRHGDLYLHVTVVLDGQTIIDSPWILSSDIRRAAEDWSDAPETFQNALYPRLAALII